MGRTRPADINPHGQESTHWHGVGPRPNVTTVTTADGKEIVTKAMNWGSTLKRLQKKAEKMPDSHESIESGDDLPGKVESAVEIPKKLLITAEWITQFMWTKGYLVGGIKVANIESGKGWQLPASDGRYLFLVNKEDYIQGIMKFIERVDELYEDAFLDVFPIDQIDLLDDPMIGPPVSMMAPNRES